MSAHDDMPDRPESETTNEQWLFEITRPVMVLREDEDLPPDLDAWSETAEGSRWVWRNVRYATELTEQAAERRLKHFMERDPAAADILARYQAEGEDLRALMVHLRDDHTLRYELGWYLYDQKLPTLAGSLPPRVAQDDYKTTDAYRGYPQEMLRSQDYAVLLGLAMLDGTFDDVPADNTDRYKEPGQHRTAAKMLIGGIDANTGQD